MKTIFITGGAGFIGSHFTRLVAEKHESYRLVVIDCLTYAGNKDNISDIDNVLLEVVDITNVVDLKNLFLKYKANIIVNFAASTHVDNSINDPLSFLDTNIYGVGNLLECCREYGIERFIQISTDEVYGEVLEGASKEIDMTFSRNPYSASKLAGEQLALSYFNTYDIPVLVTRSSNNYGPNQHAEKLIPLMISKTLNDEFLPVYGDGMQVRDWIHVKDNCEAINVVMNFGQTGEIYNIGGSNTIENIEIVKTILKTLDRNNALIDHVEDRLGHDRRYCLDSSKIKALGWKPEIDFEKGLVDTIKWYKKRIAND